MTVERSYVGEFITTLQMAGLSTTVTLLDDELLSLLDAPGANGEVGELSATPKTSLATTTRIVIAVVDALEDASGHLCELDAVAGDGDHGLAMAEAARSIRAKLTLSLRRTSQHFLTSWPRRSPRLVARWALSSTFSSTQSVMPSRRSTTSCRHLTSPYSWRRARRRERVRWSAAW